MAMYVREDAQVEALSTISAASYVQAMYRGHLGRVTYRFQATVNVLDVNLEETSELDPHAMVPALCPLPLAPCPLIHDPGISNLKAQNLKAQSAAGDPQPILIPRPSDPIPLS
jgi:hypothetical protein